MDEVASIFPNLSIFRGTATQAVKVARERESLLITLCADVSPTISHLSRAFLGALNNNREFIELMTSVVPRPVIILVDSKSPAGKQLQKVLPEVGIPVMLVADPCVPGPPLLCLEDTREVVAAYKHAHATLVKRHLRAYNAVDPAAAVSDPHRTGLSPTSSIAARCIEDDTGTQFGRNGPEMPQFRKNQFPAQASQEYSTQRRHNRTDIDAFLESAEGKSGEAPRQRPTSVASTATAVRSAREAMLSPPRTAGGSGSGVAGAPSTSPIASSTTISSSSSPTSVTAPSASPTSVTAPSQQTSTADLAATARKNAFGKSPADFPCNGIIPESHPSHQQLHHQHPAFQGSSPRPLFSRVIHPPPPQSAQVALPAHPYHRQRTRPPQSQAPSQMQTQAQGQARGLGEQVFPAASAAHAYQGPVHPYHRQRVRPQQPFSRPSAATRAGMGVAQSQVAAPVMPPAVRQHLQSQKQQHPQQAGPTGSPLSPSTYELARQRSHSAAGRSQTAPMPRGERLGTGTGVGMSTGIGAGMGSRDDMGVRARQRDGRVGVSANMTGGEAITPEGVGAGVGAGGVDAGEKDKQEEVSERGLILSPPRHMQRYGRGTEDEDEGRQVVEVEGERESRSGRTMEMHEPCPFCFGTGSARAGREYYPKFSEFQLVPGYSEIPEYQLISRADMHRGKGTTLVPPSPYRPRSHAAHLTWKRPFAGVLHAPPASGWSREAVEEVEARRGQLRKELGRTERGFSGPEFDKYFPTPEVNISEDLNNVWGQRADSPFEEDEAPYAGRNEENLGIRGWRVGRTRDSARKPGQVTVHRQRRENYEWDYFDRGSRGNVPIVLYKDACVGTDQTATDIRSIFRDSEIPDAGEVSEGGIHHTGKGESKYTADRTVECDDYGDPLSEVDRIHQYYTVHSILRDPARRRSSTTWREVEDTVEERYTPHFGAVEGGKRGKDVMGDTGSTVGAVEAGMGPGDDTGVGVSVRRGDGTLPEASRERISVRGYGGRHAQTMLPASVLEPSVEMSRPVLVERLSEKMRPRKHFPILEKSATPESEAPATPVVRALVSDEEDTESAPSASSTTNMRAGTGTITGVDADMAVDVGEATATPSRRSSRSSDAGSEYELVSDDIPPEQDDASLFGWLFGKK